MEHRRPQLKYAGAEMWFRYMVVFRMYRGQKLITMFSEVEYNMVSSCHDISLPTIPVACLDASFDPRSAFSAACLFV